MLVFVPFAEKGASQILDPMEVSPLKKPPRKVMRLLKATLLKKWKAIEEIVAEERRRRRQLRSHRFRN